MPGWNLDMSKAPRGRLKIVPVGESNGTRKVYERTEIIAAGKCGVVCLTYWLDSDKRWNMFAKGEQPIAWMPYDGPRIETDEKGRTRRIVDLPAHPSMAESWFKRSLREREGLAA